MGGEFQEQQFQCDLHGDGRDGTPSARMYPATNSWYCFACSKSRGIVDTVIAKEKTEFINAVFLVESRYKLPQIPFGDDDDWHPGGKPDNPAGGVVSYNSTFASAYNKMLSSLDLATEVRTLPMDTILVYWEAVDNVAYQAKNGTISDQSACKAMHKMHERLIEALQHGNG